MFQCCFKRPKSQLEQKKSFDSNQAFKWLIEVLSQSKEQYFLTKPTNSNVNLIQTFFMGNGNELIARCLTYRHEWVFKFGPWCYLHKLSTILWLYRPEPLVQQGGMNSRGLQPRPLKEWTKDVRKHVIPGESVSKWALPSESVQALQLQVWKPWQTHMQESQQSICILWKALILTYKHKDGVQIAKPSMWPLVIATMTKRVNGVNFSLGVPTAINAQGLLLALHLGITHGGASETI